MERKLLENLIQINLHIKGWEKIKLHGRALPNRNVGHLMTNPSIILKDGSEIPEGIMDAFISSLCALSMILKIKNSRTILFIS